MIGLKQNRVVGFTLVEIALALLVVTVGALAILGVFPSGLDASRKAAEETRAALFSEDVMNGYRALSRVIPWNDLADSTLPVAAQEMWDGTLEIYPDGDLHGLDFIPWDGGIPEYSLRYRLEIEPTLSQRGKVIRLEVFPGAVGTDDQVPILFVTEIYYSGVNE